MRRTSQLLLLSYLSLACHHVSGETAGAGPPTGPPPLLSGVARFQDLDRDGAAGPGDQVVLTFSIPVAVNTSDANALALSVPGDGFGAGATLMAGPTANEVTVVLGVDPVLRSRGSFDEFGAGNGRASGVTLADNAPPNGIENPQTGVDAQAGAPVDLWPEPVPGILSGLGQSALHLVAADLNLDGLDDLVAADGANGVDVYESLSSGGYVSFNLTAVGAQQVLLVELFDAGRADLVVRTDDRLLTFENLSEGGGPITIGTVQDLALPEPAGALAHWDFDDDGDRDLVLAGETSLWLYENLGDGTLLPPPGPLSGSPAGGRDLAVGDTNRDGWEDLLVALPGQNVLLRNLLCSSFELVGLGAGDSHHVQLIDLDRDGRLDAVSAGIGPIEVWSGTESGLFEPAYDLPAEQTTALTAVDLDGDGAPDLLLSDGLETVVLMNDGDGLLPEQGPALETGGVQSIALADVDGDGDLDLALAGSGMPQVWASSLVGTWGDPHLRESPADVGVGAVFAMVLADWNGDGLLDLATARSQRIELTLGLGDGTFGAATVLSLPNGRAHDIQFGDVDQDGDLDLVAAIFGEGPGLWLQALGQFFPAPLEPTGTIHREPTVHLADLTGDGFPELLLGTADGQADRVYRNGGGSCATGPADQTYWLGFEPATLLPGVPISLHVTSGDVDLDGDLDVLFAHAGGASDRLFLNDGDGNLALSAQVFPSRDTSALTLADVDLDGDLDLVAGMPAGNLLFFGDGAGGFTEIGPIDGVATSSARLVKLDGDAWPDLLVGNSLNHGWQAFRGTPDGMFTGGTWQRAPSLSIRALALGDVDGDGAPDFVTGSDEDGAPNRVWLSR